MTGPKATPKPAAFPLSFEHVQQATLMPDGALIFQSAGAVVEILGLPSQFEVSVKVYSEFFLRMHVAAVDRGGTRARARG